MTRIANIPKTLCVCINYFDQFGNFFPIRSSPVTMIQNHDSQAIPYDTRLRCMFPILLKLDGQLVVVVGGGAVGQRKATGVLQAGGRVCIVALEPRPPESDDPRMDWICSEYNKNHLVGATLVFAAATFAVNEQVVADANSLGIWVNCATAADSGSFIVPSVCRVGSVTVAVSTNGAAPSLARRLREKIEADLDEPFAIWVELLDEIRPTVLQQIPDAVTRRKLFDHLADWPWLDRIRTEGRDPVRQAMLERIAACALTE